MSIVVVVVDDDSDGVISVYDSFSDYEGLRQALDTLEPVSILLVDDDDDDFVPRTLNVTIDSVELERMLQWQKYPSDSSIFNERHSTGQEMSSTSLAATRKGCPRCYIVHLSNRQACNPFEVMLCRSFKFPTSSTHNPTAKLLPLCHDGPMWVCRFCLLNMAEADPIHHSEFTHFLSIPCFTAFIQKLSGKPYAHYHLLSILIPLRRYYHWA